MTDDRKKRAQRVIFDRQAQGRALREMPPVDEVRRAPEPIRPAPPTTRSNTAFFVGFWLMVFIVSGIAAQACFNKACEPGRWSVEEWGCVK